MRLSTGPSSGPALSILWHFLPTASWIGAGPSSRSGCARVVAITVYEGPGGQTVARLFEIPHRSVGWASAGACSRREPSTISLASSGSGSHPPSSRLSGSPYERYSRGQSPGDRFQRQTFSLWRREGRPRKTRGLRWDVAVREVADSLVEGTATSVRNGRASFGRACPTKSTAAARGSSGSPGRINNCTYARLFS
jgi:hypothetical protein